MTVTRRSLSLRTRFAVLRTGGFRCFYCGRRPPDAVLQIDHFTPLAAGGTDDLRNLVVSCTACNSGKGVQIVDRSGVVWEAVAAPIEAPSATRCTGERHPGPYQEASYGTFAPTPTVALVCLACEHVIAVRSGSVFA